MWVQSGRRFTLGGLLDTPWTEVSLGSLAWLGLVWVCLALRCFALRESPSENADVDFRHFVVAVRKKENGGCLSLSCF